MPDDTLVFVEQVTTVEPIVLNEGPAGPPGEGADILPIAESDVTGLVADLAAKALDADLDAEAAARASADSTEAAARAAGDATNATAITAEATARAAAVSAEATARAAADTSEASSRSAADTTLQTNIDGKQPLHANLTALAGLVGASDRAAYFTGVGALSLYTLTTFGRTLAALADAAALRTAGGLVIGTDVQAFHANLTAFAGLSLVADRLPYANGAGTLSLATFTSFGRTLAALADYAALRTGAGLVIGTDVEAQSAKLDALVALTWANNKGLRFTGTGAVATFDLSAFALTFLDDTDAATARATLGAASQAALDAVEAASIAADVLLDGRIDVFEANANLTALMALVGAADRLPYFSGVGALSLATFTAYGRTLAALADAAAGRTALALVPGTDVQAYHANLAAFAGLTLAADRLPYANGSGTLALATFTAFGRTLAALADAAAGRTALGLGTAALAATGDFAAASHTHAASDLASGQVALARGGTGADLSGTGGATKILAQAADHSVSARDLIAADIPALAASKITSGVLDQARLGSGSGGAGTKVLYDDQTYKTPSAGSGDVVGPAAATDGAVATFDGTTGKLLKDSTALSANVPATGEKAALAGTSGTPGSGNKYVTDGDARNSDTRTPTDNTVSAAKLQSDAVTTVKILDANVTLAKLANIATARILGRSTAGSGVPEELTAAQARTLMGLGALALLGTVGTAQVDDAAVTLAKMANMATASLLGRNTAGSGVPEVLSAATVRSLLGVAPMAVLFDSTLGADTATIDTGAAGVAGGYAILEIWILGRTDEAVDASGIKIQFNADTGANYTRTFAGTINASFSGGSDTVNTSILYTLPGSNNTANTPGLLRITIPGYAQTTFYKVMELIGAHTDTTASRSRTHAVGGSWRNTAAITQVTLGVVTAAKKLLAGSRMIIYGR